MDKKRAVKIFALVFFVTGVFLLFDKGITITGAAVGLPAMDMDISNVFGLFLILISLILFMAEEGGIEKIVSAEEFGRRIRSTSPDVLVLDTSAIVDYSATEIESELKKYDEVIVSESVLDEIHDLGLRKVVEQNSSIIEGEGQYRETAEEFLGKTEKHELYKFLMPYLKGEKTPTRQEANEIKKRTGKVRRLMESEGIDLETAKISPGFVIKRITDYLERHCLVSDADVDTLASAMASAAKGQRTCVAEKDSDLKQAITMIQKEMPDIGRNLYYQEPYAA